MFAVCVATFVTSGLVFLLALYASANGGLGKFGVIMTTVSIFGLVWSVTSLVTGAY